MNGVKLFMRRVIISSMFKKMHPWSFQENLQIIFSSSNMTLKIYYQKSAIRKIKNVKQL